MTAEIAILNREAVALAADSAVTFTGAAGKKIFTSANKIFALSKRKPIGIMFFGNALFMETPWETLVKYYRSKLGDRGFNTSEDYARDFLGFLTKARSLFPPSAQDKYFERTVGSYYVYVRALIRNRVEEAQRNAGPVGDEEVKRLVKDTISELFNKWKNYRYLPNMRPPFGARLRKRYGEKLRQIRVGVFERLPIDRGDSRKLADIAVNLFVKLAPDVTHSGMSGVVVAGFGDKEMFPSLAFYSLEGIILNRLKHIKGGGDKIDRDTTASIIPFAQRDMVDSFMEGVVPSYEAEIEKYLGHICHEYPKVILNSVASMGGEEKKKIMANLAGLSATWLKKYTNDLKRFRREKFVNPVINAVELLPKDELANMAESLVNLTSFRKRVTIEEETVGGPIDVALISKGDGFIWMKRKHYFKPELNQSFFLNYHQ